MIALTIPLKWWSRSVSVGKSQVLRPAEAETMPTMQHWHPYQPKLFFRCNLIHHDNFSFKIQSFLCKKVRLQFKPAGTCRSSSKYTDLEIPVNQKLFAGKSTNCRLLSHQKPHRRFPQLATSKSSHNSLVPTPGCHVVTNPDWVVCFRCSARDPVSDLVVSTKALFACRDETSGFLSWRLCLSIYILYIYVSLSMWMYIYILWMDILYQESYLGKKETLGYLKKYDITIIADTVIYIFYMYIHWDHDI